MEVLSIIPKKSVAKKQIVQARKGAKYCQSSFETFSIIRKKISNNPIVLADFVQYKNRYDSFFNYVIKLKYLAIKNFTNKKRSNP